MSGRKSSEVNGLLARGKNAREAGCLNYLNKLQLSEKILKENQAEIEKISHEISQTKLQMDADCQKEFPQESEHLEKQYQAIINANQHKDYQPEITSFHKRKQQLDAGLTQADREGDRIRDRIRTKDWYCDEEYKDAQKLLNTYNRLANDKNKLAASANKAAQDSKHDLIQYENLKSQLEQVLDAYAKLQKRTKELIELRAKAAEAKAYASKLFQEIDVSLAQKFLPEEYARTATAMEHFSNVSDAEAVKQVAAITEQISLFSNQLQQCYAAFLEKKANAEAAWEGNKQLLSKEKNFYFEPIDYFKNKENATKIQLLDYLADYSDKKEMIHAIQTGIDAVGNLISAEKFDQAEVQAQKNVEMIERAAAYATVLQEHMIENFYVARDIKSVMAKMGFEAGATKKDGTIKNGWRITAKNPGGERIDFQQVFINDDGEVKIEIDHKTAGNCSSKWEDICHALDEVGIYIEKIDMADGTNVINKRNRKSECSTAPEQKQRQVQNA